MLTKLKELRHNEFVRHNAIYFVGSLMVAATNYLYYPIVGRLVSTAQFGEVQALVSLTLQISLLLMVVGNVAVNIVANSKDDERRNRLVMEFGRLAVFIMLVVVLLALPFVQQIKQFLNFTSIVPFLVLCLVLITTAIVTPYQAFLRGSKYFGYLSVAGLITAGTRLLGAVALVLLGFGVNGAIGGIVLAEIFTLGFAIWAARKLGLRTARKDKWWRLPDIKIIKPELPFAGLVLAVTAITTILFSADTVLAKHYFSPHDAGLYAGIATIGRIIYFLTGSVAVVLLSSIKIEAERRTNQQTLIKSLSLTVALGGVTLLAFSLAPRFFIHLLIGARYDQLAYLLPWLSLALFLVSVINLVFSYDLALRRWSVALIGVVGLVTTGLVINWHHASPKALIQSLLIGATVTLVIRAIDSGRRLTIKP